MWVRSVADDKSSDFYKVHGPHVRTVATRLQEIDFSRSEDVESYIQSLSQTELELFDNCQTRYFLPDRHKGAVTESELERAYETLATIDLIGVAERYDEFVERLCKRLSWLPIEEGQRLNVTTEHYGLDLDDVDTRTALGQLVHFDRQLYDMAAAQLQRA